MTKNDLYYNEIVHFNFKRMKILDAFLVITEDPGLFVFFFFWKSTPPNSFAVKIGQQSPGSGVPVWASFLRMLRLPFALSIARFLSPSTQPFSGTKGL